MDTPEALILTPPAVGEIWTGQGGRYAGISLTDDKRLCHLILADEKAGSRFTHQGALDWATGLECDGHKDFDLPTRHDGIVLFDTVGDQFEQYYHWLKGIVAQYPGYAWFQYFDDGDQSWYVRGSTLRARAVRRLIIQ